MVAVLQQNLAQVAATWKTLTGETLISWPGAGQDELRAALAQVVPAGSAEPAAVTLDGQGWLVVRLPQASPPIFLASRNPGPPACDWLSLIAHLLDELSGEQTARQRLSQELGTASRRMDLELTVASQIQENFLPDHLPSLAGLEFAAALKPAYQVGGDFYDVQPAGNGFFIMLGDVAGKGIPAAMLTALIHATLKSEIQHHPEPAGLLRSINRLIYEELDRSDTFITAFLALLQADPLQMTYASAGHTTTLLWRAKARDVLLLPSTGVPLGISPEIELEQRQISLAPGDDLVLYTDGITEAENEYGRVFGTQALIDLLMATHTATAEQQMNTILSALDLHRGNLPLRDDVALFLARAAPPASGDEVLPFVYLAEKQNVRRLARLARAQADHLEFASAAQRLTFLTELELVVSEIATNVVVHSYKDYPYMGRIQGRITLSPGRVCLDVVDNGRSFRWEEEKERQLNYPPEDPPSGGYGLTIARRLLDVCTYTQLPGGRNHWHLEKAIKP